jgi:hypothetical protein
VYTIHDRSAVDDIDEATGPENDLSGHTICESHLAQVECWKQS